jgi:hypothetical protein
MHFEFDNLLLKLSSSVKAYDSCDDDIHAIVVLSKRMRHCNHDLLARLISHEFDDEDAVMPELVIGDLDTESRERGIESRENGEMSRTAWKPSDDEEEEEAREHEKEEAREGAIQEHNDNMAD